MKEQDAIRQLAQTLTSVEIARVFNYAALNFDCLTDTAKLDVYERMQVWAQMYQEKGRFAKPEVVANMRQILINIKADVVLWCFVCDRPKNDCACVENGGTY